jgi:hypothetical protein
MAHKFQNARKVGMGGNMVKSAAQTCPVLDSSSFVPVPTLKSLIFIHTREREREREKMYTANVQSSVQYTLLLLYLMLVMSYCAGPSGCAV